MSDLNNTKPMFLKEIEGTRLSSIEFVEDYVQLRFNGATLTAFTWPSLSVTERIFSWGDAGYRDSLCAEIGMPVRDTDFKAGKTISINFEDGANLKISLRSEDYRGPEAIQFLSADGRVWVL